MNPHQHFARRGLGRGPLGREQILESEARKLIGFHGNLRGDLAEHGIGCREEGSIRAQNQYQRSSIIDVAIPVESE